MSPASAAAEANSKLDFSGPAVSLKVKACLFDLDGTLVSSEEAIEAHWHKSVSSFGDAM